MIKIAIFTGDELRHRYFRRMLNHSENIEVVCCVSEGLQDLGNSFSVHDYYCSIEELKKLRDNGHIIGAHTDGHYVLSTLTKAEQRYEMKRSIDFLLSCNLYTHNTLCYPHGRAYSINDDTVAVCEELNLDYCFMVDPRDLSFSDLQNCRHKLPRYDCTNFVYGKSNYQK